MTDDVSRALRVQITADSAGSYRSNVGAVPAIVHSSLTSPVLAPPTAGSPKISGIPLSGRTLTASPGTWTGVSAFHYDWQRCTLTLCTSTGATGATYVLTNADAGHFMRVAVTPAGEDAPQGVSAETALVFGRLHHP
jgi:hypothetical protein